MKLTREQFCEYVDVFKNMIDQENEIVKTLHTEMKDWKPSKWVNNYYKLLLDMCELEENDLYGNDLEWFCFSTDFGRDLTMVDVYDTKTDTFWCIISPGILYDYIMRGEMK